MRQVPAILKYSVEVVCPTCNTAIDLLDDIYHDGEITIPLFNNKWDEVKGVPVECVGCGQEFELSTIEY